MWIFHQLIGTVWYHTNIYWHFKCVLSTLKLTQWLIGFTISLWVIPYVKNIPLKNCVYVCTWCVLRCKSKCQHKASWYDGIQVGVLSLNAEAVVHDNIIHLHMTLCWTPFSQTGHAVALLTCVLRTTHSTGLSLTNYLHYTNYLLKS